LTRFSFRPRRPRFLATAAALLLCSVAAVAITATAARAQINVTLTPDTMSGQRGDSLVFSAILTNTSNSTVFLNDLFFTLTGAAGTYLTPDTNVFFANVPGTLDPGQTYDNGMASGGSFFGINIASFAPDGTYSGTVTILGGADQNATGPISAATTFNVTVAPEPGTLGLIVAAGGAGIPGLVLTRRRRRN